MPAFSTTKINVPVLWDAAGNFRNDGIYSVSVSSIINGIVPKPSSATIPGYAQGNPVDTLFIKDPDLGGLYLSLTLAEYTALIGESASGATDTQVINWVGDVEVPAGLTVTDSQLLGIDILTVNKGGVTIYRFTHVGSTLDLTVDGGLAPGEELQIIYKPA